MDNQTVNLQVLRSPEPTAEAARKADERRRVAELQRDINELGSALEARDREVRIHSARRTGDSQTEAMTPAGAVGDCEAPQPEQLSTPAQIEGLTWCGDRCAFLHVRRGSNSLDPRN